ncbi:LysR family transcriptional regulator [Erythrobacter sp.]|uniref:LysR family transcriptional regulator n=1 Tax=Erythrobacter sp. TaxID=1042 RepID=UPI0025C360E3|nr:LysR family transcriptional regulator [Erythrobacter sp.]
MFGIKMSNLTFRNLDTQRLRTFVTVAQTANMTRAAGMLHQTQGAVSQQIRKLEEELGHTLFRRARPGLVLTESGERLLIKARRLLSINDAIWCEMTTPRCGGAVTLGVPIDLAGACRIGSALRSFTQRFPDVDVTLRCALSVELKRAVATGEADIAILEELPSEQIGETLVADRLVWIGAVGGQAASKKPLPLSIVSGSCVFRPLVLAALDEAGRPWKSVFESEHFDASLAMIRTDLAVGALISSRKPDAVEVLGEESGLPTLPPINITLATRETRSEQCNALAEHLRRELSAVRETEEALA